MKKEETFETASTAETISRKLLAPKIQKALLQDPKEYETAVLQGEAAIGSARNALLDAAFAYLQSEEFKALPPQLQKYQAKNLKTGFLLVDRDLQEFQIEGNVILAKVSGRLNQPYPTDANRVNAFVEDPYPDKDFMDPVVKEAALRKLATEEMQAALVDPSENEAFARTKQ